MFLVSSCLVGPLCSAVVTYSFTNCRSTLFTSCRPLPFRWRPCAGPRRPRFTTASHGSCGRCPSRLLPRDVACTSSCLRAPTSCSPVHVLTHVFSSARSFTCCAWSGGPQHHSSSLRALRVEVAVRPRRGPECGCDRALRSLWPPGSTPAKAVLVNAHFSTQTCLC